MDIESAREAVEVPKVFLDVMGWGLEEKAGAECERGEAVSEPIQDRECPACDRGEGTVTPPYSSILGPGMPVHHPSGNVCAKHMPQKLYDALKEGARRRKEAEK